MKTKVFLAVPTTGTVSDSQVYFLRDLENKYKDQIEFVHPKHCVRRVFHDFARNKMVEEFLESGADIMWFLDSDVTPPQDALELITAHSDKWKVAGVVYPIFMAPNASEGPQVVFTAYTKYNGAFTAMPLIPDHGLAMVDGLATGCLFIKREVFTEILPEKPYFKFTYNEEDRSMAEGEDFYFMRRLSDKGVQFFTDFSMVCKHQKNIDLLDAYNYAAGYAKKSVDAYYRALKDELRQVNARPQAKSSIILPKWSR